MQNDAGQTVQAEVEVPRADIRLVDAAVGGQQHRHRVLRDRVGRVGRHADDVDLAETMLQVDVVETCAAQGDQADAIAVEPVDYGGVHRVVDENAYPIKAFG